MLIKYLLQMTTKLFRNILNNCYFLVNLIVKKKIHIPALRDVKDIEILYKSANYVIVNKPYDVIINSDDSNRVSVSSLLKNNHPTLINDSIKFGFHFVHQLDYSTSGILCLASNKRAAACASKCFKKRLVDKYYLAIVKGIITEEFQEINLPIGSEESDEWDNVRMTTPLSKNCRQARNANTCLLVLEHGISYGCLATKVLLKPITGRRHQLRVHLSHTGHTIVGDYTYSNRQDNEPYRMYLHAYKLQMDTTLEKLQVSTKDPFIDERNHSWSSTDVINPLNDQSVNKLDNFYSRQKKLFYFEQDIKD